jgi:hypothetical protein
MRAVLKESHALFPHPSGMRVSQDTSPSSFWEARDRAWRVRTFETAYWATTVILLFSESGEKGEP